MHCPPCNHDCRQGRDCPARISDEEADQRIATPEEAEDWCARLGLWLLVAVTLSSVAAIFITFANS